MTSQIRYDTWRVGTGGQSTGFLDLDHERYAARTWDGIGSGDSAGNKPGHVGETLATWFPVGEPYPEHIHWITSKPTWPPTAPQRHVAHLAASGLSLAPPSG